ncbi:hypothetical protein MIR68_005411 [Amoeboaphelidium protococcarum]|nr:hypothetical protein MIR68_005411 [Amoeboaphelidium protococcarum]
MLPVIADAYIEAQQCSQVLKNFKDDLQEAGRVCRIIYWRFGFNLMQDLQAFELHVITPFLLTDTLKHIIDIATTKMHPNKASDTISADTLFQPSNDTLGYDTMQPVSPYDYETYSVRRLCIEILSEMSNYAKYRAAIGRHKAFLPEMVQVLKAIVHEIKYSNLYVNDYFKLVNCSFMAERIVNLLANLAFDLDCSKYDRVTLTFKIHPQSLTSRVNHQARKVKPLKRYETDLRALKSNHQIQQKTNKKHLVNSDTVCSYLIENVAPLLLSNFDALFGDQEDPEIESLWSVTRFISNCSRFSSKMVLLKLSVYNPVMYLYRCMWRLQDNLIYLNAQEQKYAIILGEIEAASKAILYLSNQYHEMLRLHQSSLCWVECSEE